MKTVLVKLAVVATITAIPLASRAQNFVPFTNAGTGSWGSTSNWETYIPNTPLVPEGRFSDVAVIENGGVAQVDATFVSGASVEGPGQIVLTAGTIQIQDAGRLEVFVPGGSLVDGSIVVNGELNIQGGGQLSDRPSTSVPSSLTFGASSTYSIDYTAATSAPIDVSGAAQLNGTLSLDFSGIAAAGTHPVLSAGSVVGSFANVDAIGLGAAQTLVVTSGAGLVEATVSDVPTLTINRETGEATITNTHGTPLSLDGYSISSPLGALSPANFSGLTRSGWDPAGAGSSNLIAEAYEGPNASSPSDALPSATPNAVGAAGFWSLPDPQAFLQETEELVFEVTDAAFGPTPIQGVVNYVGEKTVNNNIVLYVDPAGNAAMLNESGFQQDVEIYRISSSGSALQTDTWAPLADQSLGDALWQVSAQSGSSSLLEVTEDGATLFDRFTRFDIGQILDPGYSESGISFEFLIEGDNELTPGAVLFVDTLPNADAAASLGDFNADGIVNAADYVTWRDNIGQPASVIGNNGTGASTVVQADYDVWAQNYGQTYGSPSAPAAAPEPGACLLLATAFGLAAGVRCRKCGS